MSNGQGQGLWRSDVEGRYRSVKQKERGGGEEDHIFQAFSFPSPQTHTFPYKLLTWNHVWLVLLGVCLCVCVSQCEKWPKRSCVPHTYNHTARIAQCFLCGFFEFRAIFIPQNILINNVQKYCRFSVFKFHSFSSKAARLNACLFAFEKRAGHTSCQRAFSCPWFACMCVCGAPILGSATEPRRLLLLYT